MHKKIPNVGSLGSDRVSCSCSDLAWYQQESRRTSEFINRANSWLTAHVDAPFYSMESLPFDRTEQFIKHHMWQHRYVPKVKGRLPYSVCYDVEAVAAQHL